MRWLPKGSTPWVRKRPPFEAPTRVARWSLWAISTASGWSGSSAGLLGTLGRCWRRGGLSVNGQRARVTALWA